MPAGMTTTGSLGDSLDTILDEARIVREYEGVYLRTCDVKKLGQNEGLSYEEASLAQLLAQAITETTELNNPQQMADTLLQITPTVVGIQIRITDRVYARLSKKTIGQMGKLGMNAMARKADEDYLATIDAASNSAPGTGVTLTSGHISAYARQITSNVTEPSLNDPIYFVGHGYQIHDIQTELVSGVGTYAIPNGMTEDVYRNGFRGSLFGVQVFEDGNITIDSASDAKGGVHSKMAIVHVKGRGLRTAKVRQEHIGGGAEDVFMYDEYANGERSSGNWLWEVYSNATEPTS